MPRSAKAVVARELNQAVTVEEVMVEEPRHGEVMIRMAACGVCHSDLSATNGTIPYPLPLVLGHEGAGVVESVGEGVSRFKPGDHVLSSFVSMCGRCRDCQRGRPQLCEQVQRTLFTLPDGSTRVTDRDGKSLNVFSGCGTMAELATLHQDSVVKIESDIPLDRAALIGCGVMTGVGAAVNTAGVDPGSTAIVYGCGGVGLNVIQGCAIAGAHTIVAIDMNEEKLEFARQFGATHAFNAGAENLAKSLFKLTAGGADFAFDCVGNGRIGEQAFAAVRRGGVVVVVGIAPPRDQLSISTAALAVSEKTLTGSFFGSARPSLDFPRLIALYRNGRLKLDELIDRTYPIESAPQAFEDLKQGRQGRGVIVFDHV